jgi:hypothetical protein
MRHGLVHRELNQKREVCVCVCEGETKREREREREREGGREGGNRECVCSRLGDRREHYKRW